MKYALYGLAAIALIVFVLPILKFVLTTVGVVNNIL